MAIRYDKKLNNEINKTIRNFNQKIARLEKQEKDVFIPDKITKKELKESVYTRQELYRKIRELQNFSKRGAENVIITSGGVRTSSWEIENLKRENRRLKMILSRDIKRLETTMPRVLGKLQTGTFAQMGDTQYLNIKARREALNKDYMKLDLQGFKSFQKLLKKTAKNKSYMNNIFKGNYIKMLTDLGYFYGYDKGKMRYLEENLASLDSNKFLKLFNEDKSIKAILDYYPIITDTLSAIDPEDVKADVFQLYDLLIDNLDDILNPYA